MAGVVAGHFLSWAAWSRWKSARSPTHLLIDDNERMNK
jgi:hypothetical protein